MLRWKHVFLALDNVPEGSTECVQILFAFLVCKKQSNCDSEEFGESEKSVGRKASHNSFSGLFLGIRIFENLSTACTCASSAPPTVFSGRHGRIKRCVFQNKEQSVVETSGSIPIVSGHCHPLSLQALGAYLKGIDAQEPLQWIQKSKILQERKLFYNHRVFDILRAGYDALPTQQDKLIFLDIAVSAPRGKLNNLQYLCNWLGAIHGMDQELILYKIKNLLRNSLSLSLKTGRRTRRRRAPCMICI